MSIIKYKYRDAKENGWDFTKVELGEINLIVGASGSGKTRFLNTLFNLAKIGSGTGKSFAGSIWNMEFDHNDERYSWEIETYKSDNSQFSEIKKEKLTCKNNGQEDVLIDREGSEFYYNGNLLPKLSKGESGIYLLKDEERIEPLHKIFARVMRRYFSEKTYKDELSFSFLPNQGIDKFKEENDIKGLFGGSMDVSTRLWLMKEVFPEIYNIICDYYREVFPFVHRIKLQDLNKLGQKGIVDGVVPAFSIKEKNIDSWLTIDSLSSGMQKVLLILVDVCTLPNEATYIIDEYENSLGVNAIDFFPDFLDEYKTNAQIIITSHHPYIINNIGPENWLLFHRKGSNVKIQYGEKLKEKMGKSKQQYFIKLINDPFYTEGIE
jgi:ABC-type multidrug transport system ATPase subunit